MTLRPTDEVPMGIDGPPYGLNLICAQPFCLGRATENHHIWRRSLLGGAYRWVMLDDGSQIGNLVGFCNEHHRQLTDNQARISLEFGSFLWIVDGMEMASLTFQPPFLLADSAFENPGEKTGTVLDNECPSCGRPLPHAKPKERESIFEERRPRRSWTITVPVDERENGAFVLDELLEGCRVDLDLAGISYSPGPKTKYYVAAAVFALFHQHFRDIVSDE